MLTIGQRPFLPQDRSQAGHWEGDLIIGKDQGSAIGTLVERQTRTVLLLHMPQLVTFDSMGPGHVPEGWGKKLMHAQMTVGGQELMGSDAPPDRFERQQGFSMSVHVDQPAEAERVFAALAQNGTVRMPIQKTAWSEKFGMLTDQFGIPWMVNCAAAANATA